MAAEQSKKHNVSIRMEDELYKRFSALRESRGGISISELARELIEKALDAEGAPNTDATTLKAARHAANMSSAALMSQAVTNGVVRPDLAGMSDKEIVELSIAAGAALGRKNVGYDFDAAITQGRKDIRKSASYKQDSALLDHVASIDSQGIFNAIDPCYFERWIPSMRGYRYTRGTDKEYTREGVVARRGLLEVLRELGISTIPRAQELLTGDTWKYIRDAGWAKRNPDCEFISVCVSDYTDLVDDLDPNPGNYSPTGIANTDCDCGEERKTSRVER